MTSGVLERTLLAGVRAAVASQVGLSFPEERAGDLERGVLAAATSLSLGDPGLLARRIVDGSLSPADRRAVVEALTVSETYFRREPAAFDALEQVILPRLVAARAGTTRELRLWSAGCCTGEEAYSLAVSCLRAVPEPGSWRIDILGTDINERSLERARNAVYGRWSFRGTPAWFTERHCRRIDERSWAVLPRERGMVRFESSNLVEPPSALGAGRHPKTDVIFCRNVIMYLTPDHQRAVLERFHAELADDGVLVMSPAEGGLVVRGLFAVEVIGGALIYRKAAGGSAPAHHRLSEPHRLVEHHRHPAHHRLATHHRHHVPGMDDPLAPAAPNPAPVPAAPAAPNPAPVPAAPAAPADLLADARALADQGRLEDAIPLCQAALATPAPSASAAYLLATIHGDLGRTDDQAEALRAALSIDPSFVLAHQALADIARRAGRDAERRRHLERALAILRSMSRDEPVAESDGLTAGRLSETIARMLHG